MREPFRIRQAIEYRHALVSNGGGEPAIRDESLNAAKAVAIETLFRMTTSTFVAANPPRITDRDRNR